MTGGSPAGAGRFVGNGAGASRLRTRFGRERATGRWAMITLGKLTTLTAYASLAFVGAIVLGLL